MRLLNLGLCGLFLAFATLRAARVPLTYDEAASYIRYVDSGTPSVFDTSGLSIFNFEVATNHFLNTVFTKVFTRFDGGSEFVLRVPNLLGYAMFMIFALLILRRYVRPFIATAGFVLLNLNPYVLDFFTLSRGYGLSLGFLMGAMFWTFRCLDRLTEAGRGTGEASVALAFALGAVMSNFALLNVWLSIFGVLLAGFMFRKTLFAGLEISQPRSRDRSVLAKVSLALTAALFTALVFSQDSRLSSALYEPVSVKITGLEPAQRDRVTVVRLDLFGRPTFFPHERGATEWRWPDDVPFRGLRIELPAADADGIEHIEVALGSHLFSVDPRRAWIRHDRDSTAVFDLVASVSLTQSRARRFQAVLNWAGDARYARTVGTATAIALGILVVIALSLRAAGWAAVRLGILAIDQWRPFESAALWAAAFAGPPLYLLRRNAELYFGGTHGLIQDTFVSTIENSFYGRIYQQDQTQIVLLGIVVSLVVFFIVLYRSLRRHTWRNLLPAITVLAVLVLTSLSVVTQHVVLHSVYLLGRTALFYIPLYVLFTILLSEAIAASGRRGETSMIAILVGLLSFSAYHFASTANLKYAWDWRDDASTRLMMEDVQQIVEAEGRRQPTIVLGVDPAYIPVAAYYAQRSPGVAVKVVSSGQPDRPIDFLYCAETPAVSAIRRYPATRTVLVKTGT